MNQFDRAGIVIREIRDVLFLGPPGTKEELSGPGPRLSGHQGGIHGAVSIDLWYARTLLNVDCAWELNPFSR